MGRKTHRGHRQPNLRLRLGLDLGRVITDGSMDDMMRELERGRQDFRGVPHVGGVFRGVRRLTDRWFGPNVWIISACPPEMEEKLDEWLGARAFYTRTGMPHRGHVYFCSQWSDKATLIRRRKLAITHFVDDRPEALIPMLRKVPHLFLFNPEPEVLEAFQGQLDGLTIVWSWPELVTAIGTTLRGRRYRRQRHRTVPRRRKAPR